MMRFKNLVKVWSFLLFITIISSCKTTQSVVQNAPTSKEIKQYQGGMWIPSELAGTNEKEMKALGSTLSVSDIYDPEKPSIKDAIVQFGRGCTAEIISPKGLILTNHHCGYGQIQSHSSVEHDYLTEGFWAQNLESELSNPGLTARIVVSIDNVSELVFSGTNGLTGKDLEKKIAENIEQIKSNTPLESYQTITVKPFSNGNSYYKIISNVYKDVRLVGAPPSSVGKFGADTDNWMWPRHSGDFSLFRIYADTNNKPAAYHIDNVPYTPKHYLPVSTKGVQTGDFTMVFGFPGRTSEYLPAVAIDQIVYQLNPDKIAIREAALAVMDGYMRKDPQIKIQYASKYAGIANYWKKWIGESQGLVKSNAIELKKDLEAKFQEKIEKNNLIAYQNILQDFQTNYQEFGNKAQQRDYFTELLRNVDLTYLSYQLFQLEQIEKNKGLEAFLTEKDQFLEQIKDFYKDYNVAVDRDVFAKVMYLYDKKYANSKITDDDRKTQWEKKANELYNISALTSYEGLEKLLNSNNKNIIESLNQDLAYAFVKAKIMEYMTDINPKYNELKDKIDATQKVYTKALTEVFPEMRYFPDANSTIRVTYGQVNGYEPRDGVVYEPVTYLEGVMEKYIPGDYEFDVSSRLIDLYNKKDYGRYAEHGKLPVNFLGTNHTTGGNSGSPVLDAYGNLIGLNFDRVWEGTMSDYNYDANICRNVMVDVRYILFMIDKYAGATHLIDEMDIR